VIRNAGELMWRGSSVIRSGTVDVAILPPVPTDGWHADELDRHIEAIRRDYTSTFVELAGPDTTTVEREVVHA
jgi:hypothetical protein